MRELSPFSSARGLVLSCISLFSVGFTLAACQASMNADASAQASSKGDAEVDFDAEGKTDWESAGSAEPTSGASTAPSGSRASAPPPAGGAAPQVALFGARRDLQVAAGRAPNCKCLAVLVGEPSTEGFSWTGPMPLLNRSTQLVVGISSSGVSCDVQAAPASYMGYEQRDADVIVQVEGAIAGRPLTQGAIVPRPPSGGRILIEGAGTVPYGQAVTGNGACVIRP